QSHWPDQSESQQRTDRPGQRTQSPAGSQRIDRARNIRRALREKCSLGGEAETHEQERNNQGEQQDHNSFRSQTNAARPKHPLCDAACSSGRATIYAVPRRLPTIALTESGMPPSEPKWGLNSRSLRSIRTSLPVLASIRSRGGSPCFVETSSVPL